MGNVYDVADRSNFTFDFIHFSIALTFLIKII